LEERIGCSASTLRELEVQIKPIFRTNFEKIKIDSKIATE
jgi:hypothetical protein